MEAQIAAMVAAYQRNNRSRSTLQRQTSDVAMSNSGEPTASTNPIPTSGVAPGSTPIVWRCPFGFLGCVYIAEGLPQWDQHYQWHTSGQLPRYLECPFIGCSWSFRNNAFGPETWEKRLLHIMEAHTTGASVRTHPSRGMAEYLFEEGMLSDEQARDLRQQGYLDEEMEEFAPVHEPTQSPSTAIEVTIRHRPDHSPELPQLDRNRMEIDPAARSSTDGEPVASPKEGGSGHDGVNSDILCLSAAEDDSTMPVWSSSAISEQQQAEVADLFALRSAVWHMARRATDLSEPVKLPPLETAAPLLRPMSPSPDSMDIGYVPRRPKYETRRARLQRRNSWSASSNRPAPVNPKRRASSVRPNSSRDWLQESDCIDHAQDPGIEDGTRQTAGGKLRAMSSSGRGPGTPRRRPADDEDEDNSGQGQDDWRKRRRLNDLSQKVRVRFPCIFLIGERDAFLRHTATYEHISELLRHLATHDFHACQKCFTKFDSAAENRNHVCKKICMNSACRRTVLLDAPQASVCNCVTTAVEQWQQLFALQYPGQPVPSLQPNLYNDPASNLISPHQTTHPVSAAQIAPQNLDPHILGMLSPNSWNLGAQEFNPLQTTAPRTVLPTMLSTLGHDLQKDYQILNERLSQLERKRGPERQRETDDSKGGEVLETLLLFIWEALCETGPHKSRVGGPLWRMMQRDAPGVLSQAASTGVASSSSMLPDQQVLQNGDAGQGQQMWGNGMAANGVSYDVDSEWMLAGHGDLSSAHGQLDSGFGGM
ncbi:hypothetical protein BST61_g1107 [Cercospora zeina]